MVTDYRRFAGTVGAVMSLCCGAQCFVAQSTLLNVSGCAPSGPSEISCGVMVTVNGGRRQDNLRMAAESEPLCGTAFSRACAPRRDDEVPSSGGDMTRRQALSKVLKTAFSLSVLGAATVIAGGPAPAEAGIAEDIGGFLLPPQDRLEEIVVGDVDKEVSFEDFERALLRGDVTNCEFFGSNFDKAVIVFKDGTRALIGEGYPEERAFSDDSPMKVVGLLRNAGVPFTTQFRTGKYAKPKSYKTSGTIEAENRQKSEGEALELLMSQ